MKRKQIVERIAHEREVPLHTAADWLDSFLHDLVRQLKTPYDQGPEAAVTDMKAPSAPPASTEDRKQ